MVRPFRDAVSIDGWVDIGFKVRYFFTASNK